MRDKPAQKSAGVDWKAVTFVVGHREDQTPEGWKANAFVRECDKCASKTYTEIEYPVDVPLLCNVCAAEIAAQNEQDPQTLQLFDLPDDLKIRLLDIAQKQRLPIEEVCNQFISWKLGRQTEVTLYKKPDNKKQE